MVFEGGEKFAQNDLLKLTFGNRAGKFKFTHYVPIFLNGVK